MPPRVKTVAPVSADKALEAIVEFAAAKDAAREATSAANRAQTKVRNALKGYATGINATTPPRMLYDGNLYTVDVTENEEIDPEKWLAMLENGDINREQYLEAISVGKEDAKRIIGEDQVNTICHTVYGQKADVRILKYDGPAKPDGAVLASERKTGLQRISSLPVGSAKPLQTVAKPALAPVKPLPPKLKAPVRRMILPLKRPT